MALKDLRGHRQSLPWFHQYLGHTGYLVNSSKWVMMEVLRKRIQGRETQYILNVPFKEELSQLCGS